ncbi:efflux RND transporter permease subunit [Methylopila sp. Yamaguchi]|uniref:efflux RND transporter permease subunit n=1 Tax=Methylopila sp. Yamaguchi TaxID=1437817 RepID=UPI000CC66226|nr:efflux RND transporter permease subunit [Methylopila sp. Yamaguchi]GBD47099.1 cation efflux system protein [Methylopila sp. Yamaguchi]
MSGWNLSALAVRERGITLFLILAIIVSGLVAYLKLGRAEDPLFTVKVMTVTAVWPGATAQEMQALVADPIEKKLQELQYYDRVETLARPGLSLSTVTFLDATPPEAVPGQFYEARKKLELGDLKTRLPQGTLGPFVNDEYSDVVFAVYALKGHGLPERQLVRHAETVRQRLLHLPGVKKVDIVGERPEQIFVNFSYARLSTLGVSPGDVFAALQRQNAVTPAGSVTTSGPEVVVRLDGALDSLDRIRETPIVSNGRILKLSDIATVERGYEDPPTLLVRNGGEEALILNVVMKERWNGLDLGAALAQAETTLGADLPVGVTISKVTDQAVNIEEAIGEFTLKFYVALAVVMIVCLISLGWRVGIVVAAAVPLTLAIVLVVMMVTGRMLDRITLGALILSLGLLVDDAIVAIEIMVVKLEEGLNRVEAATYAWSHTAAPMLAGTLVTVIGFLPVGFAKSSAGEYAGNIFWVTGFALIASWVVAVAFTPYLGVKLLPDIKKMPGDAHHQIYATPMFERFRRLVGWSIRRKFVVAGMVAATFVAAIVGMGAVKQQFFPTSDRPEVLIEVQMPEGTGINVTSAITRRVEDWLLKQPEAKVVTAYVGAGAPRFFLAYNPELPDPSFAKIIVLTGSEEQREALKRRARQAVADGLAPEGRVRVTQLVFGPYARFPVAFRVMGPDLTVLRDVANQVQAVMQANPHTRTVNQDWGERAPTARFVLDQDRLQSIGLTTADVSQQLQVLLRGATVSQIREDIRTVALVVRSDLGAAPDLDRLGDLTVINSGGQMVPLAQIGRVETRPEDPVTRRRNRIPTITVQSDIDESLQPPQVTAEVFKALAPTIAALPPGYRIEIGGNAEESDKANAALAPIFPVMIGFILLVLIVQVRSFAAMFMVFLTAPLGLVGVVPTLLLFGVPFGFNGILGLIGLSGILMRNTLILIGQIHTNKEEGMNPYQAVVEATVQRARPVVLTALAAVFAFVPLTTSVFWGSLAYTLIGGTAAGTVLILLFLPALYAIWFRIRPETGASPAPQAAAPSMA